jgi:hypothetical protein
VRRKIDQDIVNAYVKVSEECADYIRKQLIEPKNVAEKYKRALKALRNHLNVQGWRMPKPKWKFDQRDTSTWIYSDVEITHTGSKQTYRGAMLNPGFRFHRR